MQIPQNIIDEVVERADIVDVLGKHLKLKRSGQNYFACCPFHNEKSASFSISPLKQMYHCFGCGESGNSISFVMKYLGLDFVSAVKSLADQYGVHIPEANQEKFSKEQIQQHKQHKLDINQTMLSAMNFYRKTLAGSSYALHYLQHRGLTTAIINQFDLGFALNNFQNLAANFNDYAKNKLLLDGGLVIENENGKRYDRFRERIMFPIKNVKGEIIGFGGRIIGQGEPKYLNSPETELFNKSKELYGLFEAKKSIRDLNQVIVVEGYMDVIALHQYGVTNVVATMGTAVTEEHIKILFRLCDNICYSFDGDSAGKKAAWRALERSMGLVTDAKAVNFLFLPSEHDPDSFIREHGVDGFRQKISDGSVGLVAFLLNQLVAEVQINTDEGKARLISLVKPYIDQIKAIALQVILKKQLAAVVDLEPSVVESILNNRSRFAFFNRKLKQIGNAYDNDLKRSPLKVNPLTGLVKSLLANPKLAREFPVPEMEVLQRLEPDVLELFNLISYLEANCDEFSDIDIMNLATNTQFSDLNLATLHSKVAEERVQHQTTFSLSEQDYRDNLYKLVYGKKRKPLPKLD
jgi:DNA primase